ncbi:hypothetical protein [Methanocella arvoryzae]|uniref:Uncharacterized protein n=1 Tax=Methanocella arvoryzae (strain DSM 22066 / NBRC 105507 / MRE50) TaxID=351160 RepID=Q0W425_METAR|nr:hypothetical protein [Methanocella arvoryzae]CAJ36868.1 hypothetical protein RCIX1633 [Methanocella arvoryzae MRE50]
MKCRESDAYGRILSNVVKSVALALLLTVLITSLVPVQVLAYTEDMFELWVGSNPPLLVQNQSYSTSTRQTLFHAADNVATDTEAFALGSTPEGGITLAQTMAGTVAGSQTGYFTSTATSDLILPARIGTGFMGTVIGDPFVTGTFFGSGMIYPQMIPFDTLMLAASPVSVGAVLDSPAAPNATTENSSRGGIDFKPVINNSLNASMGYLNNSYTTGKSNVSSASASRQNASSANASVRPAATPTPDIIKPDEPLYHQQNKPFSAVLSWPSGPGKAQRSKVQNMTAFERFLMNTVGRSTTDRAFTGVTSYPTYITPLRAMVPVTQFQFITEAMRMTLPGTQLMNRAWPL